jgi:hypothetical protein
MLCRSEFLRHDEGGGRHCGDGGKQRADSPDTNQTAPAVLASTLTRGRRYRR